MALTAFLLLDGFKGSARQKGRENHMTVHGVTHEVGREIGFIDGLPGAKVEHKFLVVTKDVDQSSPQLYEAMQKKDPIRFAQLRFWRMPPAGGTEENHFSIQLEDVQIVSIKFIMEGRSLIHEHEQISLAYKNIKWGWTARTVEPGNNASEKAQGSQNAVQFAKPRDAVLKDTVKDLSKDVIKGSAGELYSLMKGEKPPATPATPAE